MYSCSMLTNIQPMVGVDWHFGTPGPPVIPFLMPHFVSQVLGGFATSAKLVPTVLSHNFITLQRGTDIGMGIGHVAPNILFPILVLTSGSVSEFAAFSVLIKGQPTAAAVGVYVNPNLNCGDPVPAPLNIVIAPGTNMVGMSLADIFAGLISMVIDVIIGYVAFTLGNLGGKYLQKGFSRAASSIAGKMSARAALFVPLKGSTKFVTEIGEQVFGKAVGYVTGSPVGPSFGPTDYLGDLTNFSDDSINKTFMNNHYEQGEMLN